MAQARTARPKQGDFSGQQREKLMAENAAEVAERKTQIATATAMAQQEFDDNVHDPRKPDSPVIVDEVESLGMQVSDAPEVTIRVNEDIDEMTYGYRNNYSMKAGGKYRVPKEVADHLESLGLVWH